MNWETVIGLEIHAQLNTKSKLFSPSSTRFGAPPNTQTSYIDAALPGVLPVVNAIALAKAVRFGLAIDARVNKVSCFERKNYFYPDLPKGYQISQNQQPIVSGGHLRYELSNGQSKTLDFIRAHLEEDAGKSIHDVSPLNTGIDLNRAGNPLLEIVTMPCLHSAEEAVAALKTLHQLVRFLDICDGNMQEGSFRCDVNLSLRRKGSSQLGTRTELKNLNSFRFIEQAIRFEQARHQQILESGGKVAQETRQFFPQTQTTQAMRSKEQEQDYRYFPDPDLPPIYIDERFIESVRAKMPPLPETIKAQFRQQQMLEDDIDFLLAHPANTAYYLKINALTKAEGKSVVNWLKGPFSALLNEQQKTFSNPPLAAKALAELLDALHDGKLTKVQARQLFVEAATTSQSMKALLEGIGQNQFSDAEIKEMLIKLLESHPKQLKQLQDGKDKLLGFFTGQVMKQFKGMANAARIQQWIVEYMKKRSE